ncbi:MAG: 3'-5' exonuclease [Chlorobi bacterium]|nr:3'-5' exonuclease [Chlorobiota bacterium]
MPRHGNEYYKSPYQLITEISPSSIIFLDIETVPAIYPYENLDQRMRDLWHKKSKNKKEYSESAIFPEFGKVVVISLGVFVKHPDDDSLSFRTISFGSDDESLLLTVFKKMIEYGSFGNLWSKWESSTAWKKLVKDALYFMGHNIKEFDIPFLARRMIVNNIPLPAPLRLFGLKSWDVMHLIDSLELWKLGDQRSFITLELLASILGIPSPKESLSGSEVYKYYYGVYNTLDGREVIVGRTKEDIKAILTYCQGDVVTVAQIFRRLRGEPLLEKEQIKPSNWIPAINNDEELAQCQVEQLDKGLFWLSRS